MSEIHLGFGRDFLSLSFDPDRFKVLSDAARKPKPLTDIEIGDALNSPIAAPPLDEICSSTESVLIVVSDATRATGSAQIVNLLVRRLIQFGVSASNISIIFATGIHRGVTPQEKIELLTPFIAQRIRILDHDAYDARQMVSLGKTERGTPVEINRALQEHSLVIITGAVGFHYFAGFTGGRKSICPGLASARTIEATHKLAFDFETGARRHGVDTAQLSGNAVHEECESIAAMISPRFGITAEVDDRGRTVRLYAGDWRTAHYEACREYWHNHSVSIEQPRQIVVVSCGGFPYDINVIQAHKALDMAAKACAEGGTIVLVAECSEGLGRKDFLKWFAEGDSVSLATRLRESYEVNGQTAWALLSKAERYRVHLISQLPEEDVRLMRLIPARSLAEVFSSHAREPEGYIMPRGAAVLPRLQPGAATRATSS